MITLRRTGALLGSAALLASMTVATVAAPAAAGDNISVTGDYVVPAGTTVKGNVSHAGNGWGDQLTILGTVEGNVASDGGSVLVYGDGVVKGNIREDGPGTVQVYQRATVEGNVTERGDSSLTIHNRAVVKGNVSEYGDGSLSVFENAVVEGNAAEHDAGTVQVWGGLIKGNACEGGAPAGVVIVLTGYYGTGTVEGNLGEC